MFNCGNIHVTYLKEIQFKDSQGVNLVLDLVPRTNWRFMKHDNIDHNSTQIVATKYNETVTFDFNILKKAVDEYGEIKICDKIKDLIKGCLERFNEPNKICYIRRIIFVPIQKNEIEVCIYGTKI